jgi:hypothetical protein
VLQQVITAARREWIAPFTGLDPAQFRKLVRLVAARGWDAIADGRPVIRDDGSCAAARRLAFRSPPGPVVLALRGG